MRYQPLVRFFGHLKYPVAEYQSHDLQHAETTLLNGLEREVGRLEGQVSTFVLGGVRRCGLRRAWRGWASRVGGTFPSMQRGKMRA